MLLRNFQRKKHDIVGMIGTLLIGILSGILQVQLRLKNKTQRLLRSTFSTAWSPPEAICFKLREMFPDLSFSWFFDEPGMEFAGYL